MAATAPGWHPDPSGRWPLRWWDGTAWTEHVASSGRQGLDPAPGGDATSELVNRVIGAALAFVELAEAMPESVAPDDVTSALWRDAQSRHDILLLARSHLEALEHQGSDPARARAVTYLRRALENPPLMPR